MAEKFEQQIADQVSGFQLSPSMEVWKGVEKELDKDRSRKPIIFWWILLGLLIIGLGGFFLLNNHQGLMQTNSKDLNNTIKTVLPNAEVSNKDSTTNITHTHIEKSATTKALTHLNSVLPLTQKLDFNTKPKKSIAFVPTLDSLKNKESYNSNLTNTNTTPSTNHQQMTKSLPNDSSASNTVINGTFKNISPMVQEQAALKDSNSTQTNTNVPNTKKTSSSVWKLVFALGSTRLTENSLLGNNAAADRLALNNSSSTIVAGFPNANSITAANQGFHAELGVSKSWQVSKRWELASGLSYRYLQNQQMVGLKKDSIVLISSLATSNNKAVTVNGYYLAGSQNSLQNQAHWLILPVQIHYHLNPSSNIKWMVFGGASLSWNIASHWLLADQANNLLYEARPLTNLFGLQLQGGIQIQNQQAQSLSIAWEKSMNSLGKLNQSKQYWNQLQLKFSQPILLKKSTKK